MDKACEFRLPCGICNNANSNTFGKFCAASISKYAAKQRNFNDEPYQGHEKFIYESGTNNKVKANDIFKYND